MRANLPDSTWFPGKRLPSRQDLVMVELIGSGNDGHVFRAHSDELQRDFACKIIPRANLQDRWRAEVEKANALRNPAVVRFADLRDWTDPKANIDCVVLVADFVDGPNLGKFIAKRRTEISVPLVVQFLEAMFDLFNEMSTVGVTHGDLHAGH